MNRLIVVLAACCLLAPGALSAQDRPPKRPPKIGYQYPGSLSDGVVSLRSAAVPRVPRTLSFVDVTEVESNNIPAEATAVAIGDRISGVVSPAGDIDFFVFTADSGVTVDIDVEASVTGSFLDSYVELLGLDSVTVVAANDDDFQSSDSRIRYTVTATGEYFFSIRDLASRGGANYQYAILLDTVPPPDVQESEPNNSSATANAVVFGDAIGGVIDPTGDVDFFTFTAPTGTVVDIDVVASLVGSSLDAFLQLYDTDGFTVLAENDDFTGLDSHIRFVLPTTGQYYFAIRDLRSRGGVDFPYTIGVDTVPLGLGDPTTLFVTGFLAPGDITFDSVGNMFVADLSTSQVLRVTPDTVVSTFYTSASGVLGIEFNAFGELLVSQTDGTVVAVGPDGSAAPWATGFAFPTRMAMDPDGSIWLHDAGVGSLKHLDPYGGTLNSIALAFSSVYLMAFSPSGELHWTDFGGSVYKLVAGAPQFVVQMITNCCLEGLAFDQDGNIYVANGFRGEVLLFNASGSALEEPLAFTNLGGPIALSFARAADGSPTRRLYAANMGFNLSPPYVGSVVQLNTAGILADGFLVDPPVLLGLPKTTLRNGVMGAAYSDTLVVTNATGTPTWSLSSGSLPAGLSLDAATGIISGIPEQTGNFEIVAHVDDGNQQGQRRYAFTITAPSLALADVADAILGVTGLLSDDEIRYLDLLGNQNDRLDIGDFRAFLLGGNE